MRYLYIFLTVFLTLFVFTAADTFAGPDEYLGDSSIYAGVPSSESDLRPNVLFVIDNSRATLNVAPGTPFTSSENYYDDCVASTGSVDDCYQRYNIYEIDNQGDIANQAVLENTTSSLENLEDCSESGNIIRVILTSRGTYSGAGSTSYPNIENSGTTRGCSTGPTGAVYVLGNYLNYTLASSGSADSGDDSCDVVKACEWNSRTNSYETHDNKCGYFELVGEQPAATLLVADDPQKCSPKYSNHSSTDGLYFDDRGRELDHNICTETAPGSYGGTLRWSEISSADPQALTATPWSHTQDYDDVCVDESLQEDALTQREIMYNALETAVASATGAAFFGAMTYGDSNSGAKKLFDVTDLSADLPANFDLADPDNGCSAHGSIALCQFLAALPGPGEDDGAPVLSSNTARPQAEAVFDAGYYLRANETNSAYIPVNSNVGQISDAMVNTCDMNHIILLTNGFTNGDGSPKLDMLGDADGDGYGDYAGDEDAYGMGSHWLDDIAKYLNVNNEINVHTILAFQEKDSLIENAAYDGDGNFFNAYSAEDLSAALTELLATIINESNTSFVAPVVPASTTNRTVSSNNVYLGLFRPQQTGPWRGNVKKYGLNTQSYRLSGYDGSDATDLYGGFDPDSISYWSIEDESDDTIPSARGQVNIDGLDSNGVYDANLAQGDGGEVDAGGAGGVLLDRVEALAAEIRLLGRDPYAFFTTGADYRKIYTYREFSKELTHSTNALMPSNVPLWYFGYEDFGYNNLNADEPNFETLKLFLSLQGLQPYSTPRAYPGDSYVRDWVLGDVLHSRPMVFNYSSYTPLVENDCSPAETGADYNSSLIFFGANDGMMHALRDCDGQELWAFVPPNALKNLRHIEDPEYGHPTFVDSEPAIYYHDQNGDSEIDAADGDVVVLVFGQRRGGGVGELETTGSRGAYYALDVTVPDAPKFLWELDDVEWGELGETWSKPRLENVWVDDNTFKVVAFVGGGYDNNEDLRYGDTQLFPDSEGVNISAASSGGSISGLNEDGSPADPLFSTGSLAASARFAPRGRGVMAIEVATLQRADAESEYLVTIEPASGNDLGEPYWTYSSADNSDMQYPFAGDITTMDTDQDGYIDRLYAGDTGGGVWSFDLSSTRPSDWSATKIFNVNPGADSANGRKLFFRPIIVVSGGAPHLLFGTGDRSHPLNRDVVDRLYSVIDWGADGSYDTVTPNESNLVDVTGNELQLEDTTEAAAWDIYNRLTSTPSAPYDGEFTYGWYLKLDGERRGEDDLGEKCLSEANALGGKVFYTTYQMREGERSECEAGNLGIARVYEVDMITGGAFIGIGAYDDLIPPDGSEPDVCTARITEAWIDGESVNIGSATPTPTSRGGMFILNSDGSFNYTPPSGGVDTDGLVEEIRINYIDTDCAAVVGAYVYITVFDADTPGATGAIGEGEAGFDDDVFEFGGLDLGSNYGVTQNPFNGRAREILAPDVPADQEWNPNDETVTVAGEGIPSGVVIVDDVAINSAGGDVNIQEALNIDNVAPLYWMQW
ncbi:MAG: PilC/PilY family type IV pilus protein [Desulfuromonadales bacterium]|nr:PilC/PilY family type IV pilus protein [Desulfuromonadales bacterium]